MTDIEKYMSPPKRTLNPEADAGSNYGGRKYSAAVAYGDKAALISQTPAPKRSSKAADLVQSVPPPGTVIHRSSKIPEDLRSDYSKTVEPQVNLRDLDVSKILHTDI